MFNGLMPMLKRAVDEGDLRNDSFMLTHCAGRWYAEAGYPEVRYIDESNLSGFLPQGEWRASGDSPGEAIRILMNVLESIRR